MLAEAMIRATTRASAALRGISGLDAIAQGLVARGKAAWPRVDVAPSAFVAHLAGCIEESVVPADDHAATASADDVIELLGEVQAEDLWLAFACGRGDKAAMAELDRELVSVIEVALARMKDKVAVDDVAQLLREKLLVAKAGEPPKILDYSGRGPLRGWLRIAATRTALDLMRHTGGVRAEAVTREDLLDVPAVTADPELAHLRKRYAREFKEGFEAALAELTAEQRNLLRLSLVDHLSIDEIGVVFGIHRATAARQLARARETVQKRTRAILEERLDVRSTEFRSIVGYIQSHLDLSIQRLLAADVPDVSNVMRSAPNPGKSAETATSVVGKARPTKKRRTARK